MRQFPKFSQGSLLDNIKPLLIYVMETARKMTLDLTKQRELDGMQCPLTSQMAVVIDIKSAPFLPLVSRLSSQQLCFLWKHRHKVIYS